MFSNFVVLFFITTLASAAIPDYRNFVNDPLPTEDSGLYSDAALNKSVVFIGTIEGKSFFTQDVRLGWAQSLDFCHSNGMKLGAVTSATQRTMLSDFLKSGRLSQISFFYMSGTDHQLEGQWRWNIVGEIISYAPWCSGHPRPDDRGWNCHAMNSNGCWQNQNCGDLEPHRYVLGPLCEVS